MKAFAHGTVQGNEIVIPNGLGLPDGTQVAVTIEPVETGVEGTSPESVEEIAALPFFGMWANREDMADSIAWVREIRTRPY